LIDLVLSNLVNGHVRRIAVLTQYKSHSLNRHVAQAWRLSPLVGDSVALVPAQMRNGPHWYAGSADAIHQSLDMIREECPEYVCVFGGELVLRIDPRQLVEFHRASGAAVTATCSGIYVFSTGALIEAVTRDAANPWSDHDLGRSVVPLLADRGEVALYDFSTNEVPGATARDHGYWRDIADLDTYYDASMDLVAERPAFNLYNRQWPMYNWQPQPILPARCSLDGTGRRGQVIDSLVSPGVVVAGGSVRRSVVSPDVVVGDGAVVEDSVLMSRVVVGRGAVVCRAIVDKDVTIPPGARIGLDPKADRLRFHVSKRGVVAIGKRQPVPDEAEIGVGTPSRGVA
jgi:glucose-1-phosphate adenylyltransferase